MNYWVGVITGFMCSIILTVAIGFVALGKVHSLEQRQYELEQQYKALLQWYEENETVMRTYKFFNDSWQAIIDMRKEVQNDK